MLLSTVSAFKHKGNTFYLFLELFRYYTFESHYDNMARILFQMGVFFQSFDDFQEALLFYFNSLQYSNVMRQAEVG